MSGTPATTPPSSLTDRVFAAYEEALGARAELDVATIKELLRIARSKDKPKAADVEAALSQDATLS